MSQLSYPASCPSCGSVRVARILFGLPESMEALRSDLDSGRAILGGCDVSESSPQWQCCECRHEWGVTEWEPYIRASRLQSDAERASKDSAAVTRGVLSAVLHLDGDVRCPHCQRVFTTRSDMSWDGTRHKTCGTYLTLVPKERNAIYALQRAAPCVAELGVALLACSEERSR